MEVSELSPLIMLHRFCLINEKMITEGGGFCIVPGILIGMDQQISYTSNLRHSVFNTDLNCKHRPVMKILWAEIFIRRVKRCQS